MTTSQQQTELRKTSVSTNLVHYLYCGRITRARGAGSPWGCHPDPAETENGNVRLRLPDGVSPSSGPGCVHTQAFFLPIYL